MSNNNKIVAAFFAAAIASTALAGNPSVVGPVEFVSADGSHLVVLGQSFDVPKTMKVFGANSAGGRNQFGVGDFVSIVGQRQPSGTVVAKHVQRLRDDY